ncbi:putative WRKY transcription factor 57 [Drosera capensis]
MSNNLDEPDPHATRRLISQSTWSLPGEEEEVNNVFFFDDGGGGGIGSSSIANNQRHRRFGGDDVESSILGEFGWSYHVDHQHHHQLDQRRLSVSDPTPAAAADGASSSQQFVGDSIFRYNNGSGSVEASPEVAEAPTTMSNPASVSSSSQEDPLSKNSTTVSASGGGGATAAMVSSSSTSTLKVRKKGQKRLRQPQFAFMTKSEVDHLEDGYRWRKYGQKAVKNSPFPRSYYRCTNSRCTVKKRVERSSEDPTTVITTYEGQHCHHSVGFPRGGFINYEGALAAQFVPPASSPFFLHGMHLPQGFSVSHTVRPHQSQKVEATQDDESRSITRPISLPDRPTDDGLLGDIVVEVRLICMDGG